MPGVADLQYQFGELLEREHKALLGFVLLARDDWFTEFFSCLSSISSVALPKCRNTISGIFASAHGFDDLHALSVVGGSVRANMDV